MYSPKGDGTYTSGWLAASNDGVHWRDIGPVAPSEPGTQWWKGFVLELNSTVGPKYVMNHGVFENGRNDALRVLTSSDLVNWTVGATSRPNPDYYRTQGRWDHMYMSYEQSNTGGLVGFAVSSPLNSTEFPSPWPGVQRSADGIHWTAEQPLRVDWHGMRHQGIEEGGFERLTLPDGSQRFYLVGGSSAPGMRYSMWSFSAANMTGPYAPHASRFRLSGGGSNPSMGLSFEFGALAVWCRTQSEGLLMSQYMTAQGKGRGEVWMLPLRKPVVDVNGALRLSFWRGNQMLLGAVKHHITQARCKASGSADDSMTLTWLDLALNSSAHYQGIYLRATLLVTGTTCGGIGKYYDALIRSLKM